MNIIVAFILFLIHLGLGVPIPHQPAQDHPKEPVSSGNQPLAPSADNTSSPAPVEVPNTTPSERPTNKPAPRYAVTTDPQGTSFLVMLGPDADAIYAFLSDDLEQSTQDRRTTKVGSSISCARDEMQAEFRQTACALKLTSDGEWLKTADEIAAAAATTRTTEIYTVNVSGSGAMQLFHAISEDYEDTLNHAGKTIVERRGYSISCQNLSGSYECSFWLTPSGEARPSGTDPIVRVGGGSRILEDEFYSPELNMPTNLVTDLGLSELWPDSRDVPL